MNKLYRLLRYDIPMHFILLLTNWLPDNVIFIRLRGSLARPFFNHCGKRLGIGRNVVFYNPSNISIGNDVYIAYGNWFSSSFGVIIDAPRAETDSFLVTSSNNPIPVGKVQRRSQEWHGFASQDAGRMN